MTSKSTKPSDPRPTRSIMIGARLKAARNRSRRTLKSVCADAGISVSYLNLIENNKRTPPDALLNKLIAILEIESEDLLSQDLERLSADLEQISAKLAYRSKAHDDAASTEHSVTAEKLVDFSPDWSQLLVQQHRQIERLESVNRLLSDRIGEDPQLAQKTHKVLTQVTSVRSFAEILRDDDGLDRDQLVRFSDIISEQSETIGRTLRELIELFENRSSKPTALTPREEVENFLIDRGNHFPTLELGTQDLRESFGFAPDETVRAVQMEALIDDHAQQADGAKTLVARDWSRATTRFQLAKRLIKPALDHSIEDILSRYNFEFQGSELRARHALENYAAGAFLYPYGPFLERAQALRYDVDRLADETGGGFEQVAHRLVTLRRPGHTGIGFGFLRVDPAGYVSKRFNLPALSMPRTGSGCPLWIAHEAFQTPGQTRAQRIELPDGSQFLLVAKSVEKLSREFMRPQGRFSVMLACDWRDADQIVYGDLYHGPSALVAPVGTSCAVCIRQDCPQRAEDSLMRAS